MWIGLNFKVLMVPRARTAQLERPAPQVLPERPAQPEQLVRLVQLGQQARLAPPG
jgi:hypothetical protein